MKEEINMKKDRLISLCTIWVAFWILTIPLLVGCGKDTEAGKTSITIPINLSPMLANSASPLRYPTRMEITIAIGDTGSEVWQSFDVSLDDFSGKIMTVSFDDIPVEEDLLIEVFIFDEDGELLFEGREGIYISSGDTGEVVVHMEHRGEPIN